MSDIVERATKALEGVTEGPWEIQDPMGFEFWIVEARKQAYEWKPVACLTLPESMTDHDVYPKKTVNANARFIAFARTGVPELLEEVKRLREALRWALDHTMSANRRAEQFIEARALLPEVTP